MQLFLVATEWLRNNKYRLMMVVVSHNLSNFSVVLCWRQIFTYVFSLLACLHLSIYLSTYLYFYFNNIEPKRYWGTTFYDGCNTKVFPFVNYLLPISWLRNYILSYWSGWEINVYHQFGPKTLSLPLSHVTWRFQSTPWVLHYIFDATCYLELHDALSFVLSNMIFHQVKMLKFMMSKQQIGPLLV